MTRLLYGIIFCFVLILLVACSPEVVTPTVASDTPVGENVTATVTITDLPQATDTATAKPTLTSSPTEPLPTATPKYPLAGIEIHSLDDVSQAQDGGAYWLRRNALHWDVVEPSEGERDWDALASLEKEMKAISEQGMEMILIVQYTPAWAQAVSGQACGPIKVDKLPAFGEFMHDVVARYSVPPYNVKFYEMGNEPDVQVNLVPGNSQYGCWFDVDDPTYHALEYAQMLQTVYPQVKVANPEAQVLVGGLLMDCDPLDPPESSDGTLKDCTPTRFLESILQHGGGDYFDGVSFHAYDYYLAELGKYANPNWHSIWDVTGPVLINKARYLRSLLDFHNRSDAYLINTETAIICGVDGKEAVCQSDEFSQTKASYIVQSNTVAQAEGLWGNIWYSLHGWRASGLVDKNGEPYPVYHALRFNAEKLKDLDYVGEITQFHNVTVYEFYQDGKRLWVVWSRDEEEHLIKLPSLPSSAFDMLGEPLTLDRSWEVTILPVYLEWQE